jgi:Na+-transporting methylmalonyl-CoA/oxaloacetate decarboxylase beta subunit
MRLSQIGLVFRQCRLLFHAACLLLLCMLGPAEIALVVQLCVLAVFQCLLQWLEVLSRLLCGSDQSVLHHVDFLLQVSGELGVELL